MAHPLARLFVRYAQAAREAHGGPKAGAAALRWAAALAPHDESVQIELALRESSEGNKEAAISRLRIAATNGGPAIHIALARLLASLGRTSEALDSLAAVSATHPDSTDLRVELATTLGTAGRHAEALTHAGAALKDRADDAEFRGYVAFLYHKTGRDADAAREFETAIGTGRAGDRVHAWQARFFVNKGDRQAAAAAFRKGLELYPRSPRLLGDYARFLAEQGGAKEAEEALRKALAVDPGDVLSLATLGSLLTRGNATEGEIFYKYALAIDPGNEPSVTGILKLYDRDGRAREALQVVRQAAGHAATSPRVLCLCAARLAEAGLSSEAKQILNVAAARGGGDPEVALAYADMLRTFNEMDTAELYYKKALEAAGNNPRVLARVAASRIEIGKIADAEMLVGKALSLDARCADALGAKSAILAARREFEKALAVRREVIQLAPDSAASHLDAADLLARLDRYEDARIELQIAARQNPSGRLLADYAVALLTQNRAGFAVIVLSDLVQSRNGGARARFVYAHALAATGKGAEARSHLAFALEAAERSTLDLPMLADARERFVRPLDPEFARIAGGR